MAQFEEHILQANRNIHFLELINNSQRSYYDWQVTACFYCAVHLINAHLSLYNMQYRKHVDIKHALNPKNQEAINKGSALPENEYLAYNKLQSLSRRSRYLVNEKDNNLNSDAASLTYEIHLNRSLKHLNTILLFFKKKYDLNFPVISIKCEGIKSEDLSFVKNR